MIPTGKTSANSATMCDDKILHDVQAMITEHTTSNIANSDYQVYDCRESQPNGQAIQEIIQSSIMP